MAYSPSCIIVSDVLPNSVLFGRTVPPNIFPQNSYYSEFKNLLCRADPLERKEDKKSFEKKDDTK